MIPFWKSSFFIFFIFCTSLQATFAQEFALQQYTTDDGLLSACVYDMVQDEKGFLWLATEAGLCKFDGHQFTKLEFGELNNKEIIGLHFSVPDRIWIMDLSNQIYVYEQDSLRILDGSWYPRQLFLTGVHEDANDQIWILNDGSTDVLKVHSDSIFNKKSYTTYTHPALNSRKTFYAIPDTTYIVSGKGIFEFHKDTFLIHPSIKRKIYTNPAVLMPNQRDILIPSDEGNLYFFSMDDKTMRPAFEEYQEHFQVGINRIYQDAQHNLWISSKNCLLILHYQADGSYQMSKHLDGKGVGIIIQDKQQNYWISTLTDGLYFLPSIDLKTYLHPIFQKTTAIISDKQANIVLATDDSHLIVLDKNFKYQFDKKLQKGSNKVYDIIAEEDKLTISSASNILHVDKNWNISSLSRRGSFKQIKKKSSNQYWLGSSASFGIVDIAGEFQTIKKKRTYSVYPTGDERCYFGTIDGLFLYDNGLVTAIAPDKIKNDIRNIYQDADSTLYLSTQNNGLFLLQSDSTITHFSTENGLLSNNCKQVLVNDSIIWLATNKGLHKINQDNKKIAILNKANGLPNDEVNALYQLKDTIIAATNKGIAYFKETLQLETPPPSLYFSAIKINRQDTSILSTYELKPTENNIKISFSAIQFTNTKRSQYKFQMKGLSDEWTLSSNNEAQFPSLQPGNYTFLLQAKELNSDWSKPIQVTFQIAKPFWQKNSFILIAGCLLFTLIFCSVRQIIENNKRKNKIQTQIKAFQLTALRAQMNPHFMFNSLNSIQEFIQLQDKRSANKYLGQFAQLMRIVLNISAKETISLQQEMEALQLYLSLESMRFEDAFEYQVKCPHGMNAGQVFIPPMLIQPYVENAILHGLNQKEGSKQLLIRFSKKDDFLTCTITDNGIGRAAARVIKAKKEQLFASKGMNLIEKRLNLINSAAPNKLTVLIDDLYDEYGNASGTKVTLHVSTKV